MNKNRFNFRVWDTTNGEWFDTSNIIINGSHIYNGWRDFDDGLYLRDDDYIICQCTGVEDSNGNFIYEGDILKDEFDKIHKVYWKEDEGRFAFITNGQKTEYFLIIQHFKTKIIGNIYENENLIK